MQKRLTAMIIAKAIVTAWIAILATPVTANSFVTGQKLVDECKYMDAPDRGNRAETLFYATHCAGFIDGVNDALDGKTNCVPQWVIEGQVEDVVRTFLAAHPERLKENAAPLVAEALKERFPCR